MTGASNKCDIARRAILGGIGGAAGLAITGAGSWDHAGVGFSELYNALVRSLSPTQKQYTFLPSDHPARQITLTQAVHQGPHIGTLYNSYQTDLIRKIYQHLLSLQGQHWMRNTISLEGRFEASNFKIYSNDPERLTIENSQVVINGGHYMLRSKDLAGSGYALGGPISYGQQLGDKQYKVEGNAFKAHGDALDQFHRALSKRERLTAYENSPPYELLLQIQGNDGVFSGIRIGAVSDSAQEVAQDTINTLLSGFTAEQRSEAWSAIDDNGGIESLYVTMFRDFSFYAKGVRYTDLDQAQRNSRDVPYAQVWRIEGPAFVMHFQGYPHVHAYLNIVRDPSKIAIGEALTETPRPLSQTQVKNLIVSMLKERSNQSLAFYPDSLLGRLSPGVVSSGSVYTLDPFANEIVIAEISTETMSNELLNSLRQQGVNPLSGKRYRVATIDYMLARKELFGVPEQVVYTQKIVRDQLVEFFTDKDLGGLFV